MDSAGEFEIDAASHMIAAPQHYVMYCYGGTIMKKLYFRILGLIFVAILSISLAVPAIASPTILEPCSEDCKHTHVAWEDYEQVIYAEIEEPANPDNIICSLLGHDYSVFWMTLLEGTSGPNEAFCWVKAWTDYYLCSRCDAVNTEGERRFSGQQHPDWEIGYAFKTCTDCGYVTEKGPFDGYSAVHEEQ